MHSVPSICPRVCLTIFAMHEAKTAKRKVKTSRSQGQISFHVVGGAPMLERLPDGCKLGTRKASFSLHDNFP